MSPSSLRTVGRLSGPISTPRRRAGVRPSSRRARRSTGQGLRPSARPKRGEVVAAGGEAAGRYGGGDVGVGGEIGGFVEAGEEVGFREPKSLFHWRERA